MRLFSHMHTSSTTRCCAGWLKIHSSLRQRDSHKIYMYCKPTHTNLSASKNVCMCVMHASQEQNPLLCHLSSSHRTHTHTRFGNVTDMIKVNLEVACVDRAALWQRVVVCWMCVLVCYKSLGKVYRDGLTRVIAFNAQSVLRFFEFNYVKVCLCFRVVSGIIDDN